MVSNLKAGDHLCGLAMGHRDMLEVTKGVHRLHEGMLQCLALHLAGSCSNRSVDRRQLVRSAFVGKAAQQGTACLPIIGDWGFKLQAGLLLGLGKLQLEDAVQEVVHCLCCARIGCR